MIGDKKQKCRYNKLVLTFGQDYWNVGKMTERPL